MNITETFDAPLILNWTGDWLVEVGRGGDGTAALRSRAITHNETTTESVIFTLDKDHFVSFSYGVISEANYDKFTVKMNDDQIIQISGNLGQQGPWRQKLAAGKYTFTFMYSKDGSGSTGADCAWIDDFRIRELNSSALCVYNGTITPGGTDGDLISDTNRILLKGSRDSQAVRTLALRAPGGAEYPVVCLKEYIIGPQANWFEISFDAANFTHDKLQKFYIINENVLLYIRCNIPEDADFGNNEMNYLIFDYLGGV